RRWAGTREAVTPSARYGGRPPLSPPRSEEIPMAVPIAARDAAAVVGALLVLTAAVSVVGALVVAPSVASRLTRWVGALVGGVFNLITSPIASYRQRDRILAAEAATFLICQLVVWLLMSFVGYTLLVWPFTSGGITSAVTLAGPAVFGPNEAL